MDCYSQKNPNLFAISPEILEKQPTLNASKEGSFYNIEMIFAEIEYTKACLSQRPRFKWAKLDALPVLMSKLAQFKSETDASPSLTNTMGVMLVNMVSKDSLKRPNSFKALAETLEKDIKSDKMEQPQFQDPKKRSIIKVPIFITRNALTSS